MDRQSPAISEMDGFIALYVIRGGPLDVAIVRVFATAAQAARSLGTSLRPGLGRGSPLRLSG